MKFTLDKTAFYYCIALFVLELFITSELFAQNLLPNSSFEDIHYCESKIPCSPSAWFSVNNLPYGYQEDFVKPGDGKKCVSFMIAGSKGKPRNYWQTKLLCNTGDEEMLLQFYLYTPSHSFNPEYFGFAFVDELIWCRNDSLLSLNEYTNFSKAVIRQQKNGWYKIEIACHATAKQQVFILGNFDTTIMLPSVGKKPVYEVYFIDEVQLTPVHKLNCNTKAISDSLYSIVKRHSPYSVRPARKIEPEEVIVNKTDTFLLSVENFDLNSSKIKAGNKIDSIFSRLNLQTIDSVFITGYTDNLGTIEYNYKLSLNRALAVKNYILEKFYIDEAKVFVEGKGISTKFTTNELNRRTEIIVKYYEFVK